MKHCSKCNTEKDESQFYKTGSYCKPCQKIHSQSYYAQNKDRMRASNKKYISEHQEQYKAVQRDWHQRRKQFNPQLYLLSAARARAKKFGLEFTITPTDIIIPEKCPILDIELKVQDGRQAPNSPSLDRIDNSKGYIPGNVVVISWRANSLKNDASLEELRKIVDFYGRH